MKKLTEILLVCLIYIVTARIGQVFAIPPGNITPIWLPSGIMLAWVLIRGSYIWPGIFLGAFLGNIWAYIDFSSTSMLLKCLFSASMNGVGDVLCSVWVASLIKQKTKDANLFNSLAAFGYFFIYGVLLGPFVSSVLGTGSLWLTGFLDQQTYWSTLLIWFIGDGVGVLILSPLLLMFYSPNQENQLKTGIPETLIFLLMVVSIPIIGIALDSLFPVKNSYILVTIPIFLWGVIRLNQKITFTAAAVLSITSVIFQRLGFDPFVTDSVLESVLSLQITIGVAMSSLFVLTSLVNDREMALKSLNEKYNHDALTGIYTRQYFDLQLDNEIKRNARYNFPFSLIMFDIDHFKNVNDQYGHLEGDKVLKHIVQTVSGTIREVDVFARWGGEEFIIMLPHTRLADSVKKAEEIRHLIENTKILSGETITISLGVIEFDSSENRYRATDRLDHAMYEAKHNGRNLVRAG